MISAFISSSSVTSVGSEVSEHPDIYIVENSSNTPYLCAGVEQSDMGVKSSYPKVTHITVKTSKLQFVTLTPLN